MRSYLALLFALVTLAAPTLAQVPPEKVEQYNRQNNKGVELIRAGKFDEGIAAFKALFELAPQDSAAAYNIACCYSLKKELDPAFQWLEQSMSWGWVYGEGNQGEGAIQLTKTDPDLENLRADPRFAAVLEKMAAQRKTLDDYVAAAVVYVPEKLAGAETLGLLVALHDAGQTKDLAFEKGPWKQLADELGLALILPSGKVPQTVQPELRPQEGMSWIGTFFTAQTAWKYEKPVDDAVNAFKKEHKLDLARVFIAGDGEGGVIAFDIAVSKPGLYKGVIVAGGRIVPELAASKGANAGKMGLKARLLLDNQSGEAKALEEYATKIGETFKRWNLAGTVERFERKPDDPAQMFTLVKAAIEAFSAPAAVAPAEAGSVK